MITQLFGYLFNIPVLLAVVTGLISYYFISTWNARKNIPPGPWPLPIVGNLLVFKGPGTMQEKIHKLADKWGDPMSLWFGNRLSVCLNKKETIRDMLFTQQSVFCSRQDSLIMDIAMRGSADIAMGKYGPAWKIHRKLANRSLRAIIDKSKLEDQVAFALDLVEESLLKTAEKGPLIPHEFLANTVFNVIVKFSYDETYTVDDPEFQRFFYLNKHANESFVKVMALDFIPGAAYLPLERMSAGVRDTISTIDEMREFFEARIQEHRDTYQEGELRDFIDAMIKEENALKSEGDEDARLLSPDHLMWIVFDFFSAGTDTTAMTLTWFFLFMTIRPEIQEECYQAISKVCGNRFPTLKDRSELSLVEACINETMRLRPPAPLGVPHTPIEDATLSGYRIPKDTIAMPNIYGMHIDPEGEFAPNPLDFDPEGHFLEADGVTMKKTQAFLPFGGGRRVCLGEQLARNILFLITSGLLSRLKFERVPEWDYNVEPDPAVDAINYCREYKVVVSKR